jgi:hypothetical protein
MKDVGNEKTSSALLKDDRRGFRFRSFFSHLPPDRVAVWSRI